MREQPPTDPSPPPEAPADEVFADFVKHANRDWVASVEALLSEPAVELPIGDDATDPDRVAVAVDEARQGRAASSAPASDAGPVLLTKLKSFPPPRNDDETTVKRSSEQIVREAEAERAARRAEREASARVTLDDAGGREPREPATERAPLERTVVERTPEEWSSVVKPRSRDTQKREAVRVVPDVASVPPPPSPPPEGSEDGLVPSGELDRKLTDMAVLLRYGHEDQVQAELEALRMQYPDDLLLLRRVAELYVAHTLVNPARAALFNLATALFERRNVEGMRQALEQVQVLDPENQRAQRLLALLEQRPAAPASRR